MATTATSVITPAASVTATSVVLMPPTLVASIYGMNFHNMPELSWTFGYPYGLAMIALSAAIPLERNSVVGTHAGSRVT